MSGGLPGPGRVRELSAAAPAALPHLVDARRQHLARHRNGAETQLIL